MNIRRMGWVLTPLGAIISLVCFFLPWYVQYIYDSLGQLRFVVMITGARWGGYCWIAFGAAVATLAAFILFVILKRKLLLKAVMVFFAAAGLVFMIIRYFTFNFLGLLDDRDLTYGFYATILSFILALFGSLMLKAEVPE